VIYERPVRNGDRDELVALLRELAIGWDHWGRHDLAKAARDGADRLELGADAVQVGKTLSRVTPVTA